MSVEQDTGTLEPAESSTDARAPTQENTSPEPQGEGRLQHPLAQDLLFNPRQWRIWPAVAILRWLLRDASLTLRGLIYRSKPSLAFAGSEVDDIALQRESIDLVLTAPGLAAAGSPLPTVDIARIVADSLPPGRGALAAWLDGPGDRFMQAVETAQARHNAAFALATGGRIEALASVAQFAGRSAPLAAKSGGVLSSAFEAPPEGAIGLAALFVGTISATGMAAVVTAFTELPARVEEFTGGPADIVFPARLGFPIARMLGPNCEMPKAGVDVTVEGGSEPSAQAWAGQAARRKSLLRLCDAYVGTSSPVVSMFLELNEDNAPPARLGTAAFGGLAILGEATAPVRLPLH